MAKQKAAEPAVVEERTVFDEEQETDKKGRKKKKKEKKPKRKKGKLFLFIFIILLIGAFCAAVYLDYFEIRTKMIDFLSSFDPEYVAYTEKVAEAEQKLVELETWEGVLTEQENSLAQRTADLDDREVEISEQSVSSQLLYRGNLSDERIAELQNLGNIYSTMDPAAAAEILPQLYGVIDMAAIIYYMDESAAATLLSLLNSALAAQITDEMLRE